MSREIKYRVYDKQEKCYSDKAFSIDQLGICYVQDEDGYWEEIDEKRYVVEQYTGLIDKNDKEIYEGDILIEYSNDIEYWVVSYEYGKFVGTCDNICEDLYELSDLEVIGNINENKELLK